MMIRRLVKKPFNTFGHPPVSKASTAFGERPSANPTLYAAQTDDGATVLIVDPVAWERREVVPGKWLVVRPEPIPVGSVGYSKTPSHKTGESEFDL
jgi:hypothetical protein